MSRPQRILRKRFVIYCEGDTEYNYVNQMRRITASPSLSLLMQTEQQLIKESAGALKRYWHTVFFRTVKERFRIS